MRNLLSRYANPSTHWEAMVQALLLCLTAPHDRVCRGGFDKGPVELATELSRLVTPEELESAKAESLRLWREAGSPGSHYPDGDEE